MRPFLMMQRPYQIRRFVSFNEPWALTKNPFFFNGLDDDTPDGVYSGFKDVR